MNSTSAPAGAKSLRLDGAELASRAAFHRVPMASETAASLRGWLTAPLTSLDGGTAR